MSEKGLELYNKIKDKLEKLEDADSIYAQFNQIWQLACAAKYKSYDLRHFYEDTSREFVDKNREHLINMKQDFIKNIEEYVEKCMQVMEKTNHFKVYYAKTNAEAQKFFMEELGDNTILYKSKSLEAKDAGIIDILKKIILLLKKLI
jgi:L-lactate utilization protein LutB